MSVHEKILSMVNSLEHTRWTRMELQEGDFRLMLEREPGEVSFSSPVKVEVTTAPTEEHIVPIVDAKDIKSPLVGVFHSLPGDKAVHVGSKVKKGQTVCMIEAMKLMNEITMPEDGEISFIAVSEGDTVEYSQLIFNYIEVK